MNDIKKAIEEFKMLAGREDASSEARRQELTDWLVSHKSGHEQEVEQLLDGWLDEMEADVKDIKQEALRQQLSNEAYKLIPWSYIAKEYFGKSLSWLTQRVNGYTVRGHVYTLNEEQKQTLNRALAEVGARIGSFRVA